MIFVTGDTHGGMDIHKLAKANFDDSKLTKDDFLIICGDFGLVWNGGKDEQNWLDWLNQKNYTTLFLDGNHENFQMLDSMKPELWHGGYIHKINNSVFHLMRGQVFEIDNRTFFVMGGATSVDKQFRTLGISWWEREMPDDDELKTGNENLRYCGNKVDYILTHTTPTSIVNQLVPQIKPPDRLTNYLQYIEETVQFEHWYFGHFHDDKKIDEKHTLVYNEVIQL